MDIAWREAVSKHFNQKPSEVHTQEQTHRYEHLESCNYCLLSRVFGNWIHDQMRHTHIWTLAILGVFAVLYAVHHSRNTDCIIIKSTQT